MEPGQLLLLHWIVRGSELVAIGLGAFLFSCVRRIENKIESFGLEPLRQYLQRP